MFKRFIKDENGNMAIMFSIMIVTLLAAVGAAVDIAQMSANRQKIADMADSTALAAALVARETSATRQEVSLQHFTENLLLENQIDIENTPSIIFDDTDKEVTVTVTAKTNFMLMGMFGYGNGDVSASSTVGYAIDYVPPISIAFAFDTSGSMGDLTSDGQVKIVALQQATVDLFQAMFDASEDPSLLNSALSTSFSTYNTDIVINDVTRGGYQHILDTMSMDPLFTAIGGTNSTPSFQFALDELNAKDVAELDSKWSGHLIFMTDGDNNEFQIDGITPTNADAETLALCDTAKTQGYKIYTIAFAAPKKGEDLLEACASDKSLAFKSKNAKKLKENFEIIGKQLGEATVRIKR